MPELPANDFFQHLSDEEHSEHASDIDEELEDDNEDALVDDNLPHESDLDDEDQLDTDPEYEEYIGNIDEIRDADQYIKLIKNATLSDGHSRMDDEVLQRLLDPPPQSILEIDDPDILFSIRVYLSLTEASKQCYKSMQRAVRERFGEGVKMLSFYEVRKLTGELTGIYPIVYGMCKNSCMAYTGPYADLDTCKYCAHPRYDPKKSKRGKHIPYQTFSTFPVGPQLQALMWSPKSAESMMYRQTRTKQLFDLLGTSNRPHLDEFDDVLCGNAYLEAVNSGDIQDEDMVLMFSADGTQLYKNKLSDFWIYIWVIVDLSPNKHYKKKHIIPGTIIPGPNKPKNLDSFLFPGLHHFSAISAEPGIPFPSLASACPCRCACQGFHGCRIYCPQKGRHKKDGTRYYPIRLKPDRTVAGSDFPDLPLGPPNPTKEEYDRNLALLKTANNPSHYKDLRLQTGICKPTIFSGISRSFGSPKVFGVDIMHLPALNIPDLLIPLWHGTLKCPGEDKRTWDWAVLQGNVWTRHGDDVAAVRPYLPTSFGRAPRNPIEKISSGYKAIEYINYIYGIGPGLFYDVLPLPIWRHYCKLVYGVRIICQCTITEQQIDSAHKALVSWEDEYEHIYYQRKDSRIPLVRPSAHTITHLPQLVIEYSPGVCHSQCSTENAIGFLGRLVCQPSNPFANLTQVTLRHVHMSALQAMVPDLIPDETALPRSAVDLGDGYVLLRAWDRYARHIQGSEARAIREYLSCYEDRVRPYIHIHRWSKVRLPNGHIARSAWKELEHSNDNARVSRMVKVQNNNKVFIAEVLYFIKLDEALDNCPPYLSHGTLSSCLPGEPDDVLAIDIKSILSVVAMVPHHIKLPGQDIPQHRFFLVEKPGLSIDILGGYIELNGNLE
ncbi:hypothetical protein OE88DRAFT_1736611 [Heliocybe sulcata]|uniref:Uncharacterized protein n=1 Tax=Heliocybe sulcata TaxID=5364 RepID=A0A5C3MX62_9AGAM|nr:hypothetical protein OE88DRAFT_1736611 [Heliocybe sulcata]